MIVLVPLGLIEGNPFQTRAVYDEAAIAELAASIEELRKVRPETCGLIHVPPARPVDPLDDGKLVSPGTAMANGVESMRTYHYQLAAGHCRKRAFDLLRARDEEGNNWVAMPLDLAKLDDQAMADVAWSENQKRKDLTAIEEARAIQAAQGRFEWTQEEVSTRWGLSRSAVANKLRLLNLPEEIQEQVVTGQLGERAARALLPALDVEDAMTSGLRVIREGGSAGDVERTVAFNLRQRSLALSDAPFPEAWPGKRHGLDVPQCKGCQTRRKVEGDWRCFDRKCYSQKTRVWNEFQINKAIEAEQAEVGTPLVAYEQFNHSLVRFDYDRERKIFEEVCKPACKHERLGLLADMPKWARDGVKASSGEAWFVCDKRRCMSGMQGQETRQVGKARRDREKEQRDLAKAAIDVVLDGLGGLDLATLASYAPLRKFLLEQVRHGVLDSGLRRWCNNRLGKLGVDEAGFWQAVVMYYLARMVDYIYAGNKVEEKLTPAAEGLWVHLGVSGETSDPEAVDDEVVMPVRGFCCICGRPDQELAYELVEGLGVEAFVCVDCPLDMELAGALLEVECRAEAVEVLLQIGEWKRFDRLPSGKCLLCNRTVEEEPELVPGGQWMRRIDVVLEGGQYPIQLCPDCRLVVDDG